MKGMGKSRWLSWAAALSLMFLFAVSAWAQAPVKNVILLIGDGMGINQISAARLSLADGARSVLNLDTMPYTGFSLNFANNNLVTDSAARPPRWPQAFAPTPASWVPCPMARRRRASCSKPKNRG